MTGSLHITGTQLTDFKGLENLQSYGSVAVIGNTDLTTLADLSANVTRTDLTITDLLVQANSKLQDVDGFTPVKATTGRLIIF